MWTNRCLKKLKSYLFPVFYFRGIETIPFFIVKTQFVGWLSQDTWCSRLRGLIKASDPHGHNSDLSFTNESVTGSQIELLQSVHIHQHKFPEGPACIKRQKHYEAFSDLLALRLQILTSCSVEQTNSRARVFTRVRAHLSTCRRDLHPHLPVCERWAAGSVTLATRLCRAITPKCALCKMLFCFSSSYLFAQL